MIMKSVGFLEDRKDQLCPEVKQKDMNIYSTFISRVLKLFH